MQSIRFRTPKPLNEIKHKAPAPAVLKVAMFGFLLVCFFLLLRIFIKPTLMGAIFAIILYPLMDHIRVKSESMRAFILTAGFSLVFLVPFGGMAVFGTQSAAAELQKIPGFREEGVKAITQFDWVKQLDLHTLIGTVTEWLPISEVQAQESLSQILRYVAVGIANFIQELLTDLPGASLSALIVIMSCYAFLAEKERVLSFLHMSLPFNRRQWLRMRTTISSLCSSVVLATFAAGFAQAILFGIACLMTGHNFALFTLMAFVCSFIPVIGMLPLSLGLMGQEFLTGQLGHGIIFLIAIPVIGIVDNVVRPFVLKGGSELHPLLGFMAVIGGLQWMGFYGLFIGPVLAGLFVQMLPLLLADLKGESVG